MSDPGSDDRVIAEIDIEAPVEAVFEALTDPEQVSAWLPDAPFAVGDADSAPDVLAIDPPYHLTWRWRDLDEDGDSTVRWELSPTGSGTHVRLVHSREVARVRHGDSHARWETAVARLRRFAERLQPALAAM